MRDLNHNNNNNNNNHNNNSSSSSISSSKKQMVTIGVAAAAATTTSTCTSLSSLWWSRILRLAAPMGVFVLGTLVVGEYYHRNNNHQNNNSVGVGGVVNNNADNNNGIVVVDTTQTTTTATKTTTTATNGIIIATTTTSNHDGNNNDDHVVRTSSSSLLLRGSTLNTTSRVYEKEQDNQSKLSSIAITTNQNEEEVVNNDDNDNSGSNNDDDDDNYIIDILSVGSTIRPYYQQAQYDTFVSHKSVRQYYKFTEEDDTESTCNDILTSDDALNIAKFCKFTDKGYEYYDTILNQWYIAPAILERKPNPAGWICAQKRPIDAIMSVIKDYRSKMGGGHHDDDDDDGKRRRRRTTDDDNDDDNDDNDTLSRLLDILPDYLFLMDDDTYYNVDNVLEYVLKYHPSSSHISSTIAGCLIRQYNMSITAPYGGWGTIFTKSALYNLLKPIRCNNHNNNNNNNNNDDDDEFMNHACQRIEENRIGEKRLFQNGMSIADLMNVYTFDQPFISYTQKESGGGWNDVGYCMHSDVTIGYFLNIYHIADKTTEHHDDEFYHDPDDRMVPYGGQSVHWRNHYVPPPNDDDEMDDELDVVVQEEEDPLLMLNECNNAYDRCTNHSHVCHYMKPKNMYRIHEENLLLQPKSYDEFIRNVPLDYDE